MIQFGFNLGEDMGTGSAFLFLQAWIWNPGELYSVVKTQVNSATIETDKATITCTFLHLTLVLRWFLQTSAQI
ncbi:MAG: hypothetical protein IJZ74_08595 [Clostridia bacterium]|nr:hypothetical protein [Clostridia bacterium]